MQEVQCRRPSAGGPVQEARCRKASGRATCLQSCGCARSQPLPSRAVSLWRRLGREGVKSVSSARQSASDGVAGKTLPGKKSAGSE